MTKNYPTYEEHQQAWEELAAGIASIREEVQEIQEGEVPLNSKAGSLTIVSTGIKTLGIAVGDVKLIEQADKVLYCVATLPPLSGLSASGQMPAKCYGSSLYHAAPAYQGPPLPPWAGKHLANIAFANSKQGGLLLWHKWEKHHFTSRMANKTIASLA